MITLRSLGLSVLFPILIISTKEIFYTPSQTELKVSIYNLRNNKGHVLVSLFRNCDGYPDEPGKAVRKVKLPIINNMATANFSGLTSGNYSIAILHDENDDLKMNKNFFGLPKEGYGFSNNVMGTFGPPSCSKASFWYYAGFETEIKIRTRY
ncbi:MAG TPA: DUF2141 domain-containing protein [Chitinophagaceae bacterium]|nr:DUF2141 domain-containing protein [Chitinophagaceae bacterium]